MPDPIPPFGDNLNRVLQPALFETLDRLVRALSPIGETGAFAFNSVSADQGVGSARSTVVTLAWPNGTELITGPALVHAIVTEADAAVDLYDGAQKVFAIDANSVIAFPVNLRFDTSLILKPKLMINAGKSVHIQYTNPGA